MRSKIAISAYAIDESHGSERQLGYQMLKYVSGSFHEILLYTEKASTIKESDYPNVTVKKISIGYLGRRICWNQGNYLFYLFYNIWQLRVGIDYYFNRREFQSFWHFNMIGFREPGYGFLFAKEFYIGPVGGLGMVDDHLIEGLTLYQRLVIRLKNIVNTLQLKYDPRVALAFNRSKLIFFANTTFHNNALRYHRNLVGKSYVINETGLDYVDHLENSERINNVLWIGKNLVRKNLTLFLRIIERNKNEGLSWHIIGVDESTLTKLQLQIISSLKSYGVDLLIHGVIKRDQVLKELKKAEWLCHTSLDEGTPHVVLEALSNGVKVACVDICGQGDIVVNNRNGMKVPYNKYLDTESWSLALRSQFNFDSNSLKKHAWPERFKEIIQCMSNEII